MSVTSPGFAQSLSHGVTVSCAGLPIQISGIPGTAWDLFGLAAHISGPTGGTRDCHDPLSHRRVSHLQATWRAWHLLPLCVTKNVEYQLVHSAAENKYRLADHSDHLDYVGQSRHLKGLRHKEEEKHQQVIIYIIHWIICIRRIIDISKNNMFKQFKQHNTY